MELKMNSNQLAELYKIRFSEDELFRKDEIWQVICADYLQQYINKSDTVVDIACGYGEFINNIQAKRKVAFDLNPDAKKFLNSGVEFYQCAATKISTVLYGDTDVIFTSNFLEHLPDKGTLDKFLDEVMLSLKLGGKYIILGPNLRYLPGKYWDYYDHHLGLTHLSLCEALQLKGFDIKKCVAKFLPYSTQGALPTHPLLVKLYLKMPIIWPILGKQFFIVAQKSAR